MKSLVVFYSHSGNTRRVAEKIVNAANADKFEIIPNTPYSEDGWECVDEFVEERDNNILREINEIDLDLEQYDTVYLGTPNWGNTMATPMKTFLSSVDLKGKTIRPFVNHRGSGVGNCARDMSTLAHANYTRPLVCPDGEVSADEVLNWVNEK